MRIFELDSGSGEIGDIQLKYAQDGETLDIYAYKAGREAGHVQFEIEGRSASAIMLEVDPQFRGQGIAKAMYDYAKEELGYTVVRSNNLTPAGRAFWQKHRDYKRSWE
jgi:ribosomal protein S18 acetylase RimI-like enzyme